MDMVAVFNGLIAYLARLGAIEFDPPLPQAPATPDAPERPTPTRPTGPEVDRQILDLQERGAHATVPNSSLAGQSRVAGWRARKSSRRAG